MTRITALLLLGGVGVVLTPAMASAQFGLPGGAPVIVPSTNPFFYVPKYRYTHGWGINTPTLFGQTSIGYTRSFQSVSNPQYWSLMQPTQPWYSQSGSYMSGSASVRPDVLAGAQRDFARAQREATLSKSAKNQIYDQWAYEKGGVMGLSELKDNPERVDAVRAALAATEPAQVASGEALNNILVAIIAVESKGAKGPSAFVPPILLDEIRFGGSSTGDALNFVRKAGQLPFPTVFEEAALVKPREELEKDFASVAVAVQAGKSPDPAKLGKLELTLQRARDAVAGIKDMPFEDATAARRFLNQMAGTIKVLKATGANTLVDPKWSAEGTTVADLVKHMTKHKLLFGPTAPGNEEAYLTMHRNLATYLFVLMQPKK